MVISKTAKRKQRKANSTAASSAAAAAVAGKNHPQNTGAVAAGSGQNAANTTAGGPASSAAATGAEARRIAPGSGAGAGSAHAAASAAIGSPLRPVAATAVASSVARCAGTPGGIGLSAAAMDVVVTPMTPEAPRRTKVHAQRKFAQGQGCSSTYAPNQSLNASNRSAAAEASIMSTASASGFHSEPVDVLPNNIRPSTEDFLKFLCFRGTPVLPSHLDYFNNSNAAAAAQAAATAAAASAAAAAASAAAVSAEAAATASAHTASSSSPSATAATNATTSGVTVAGVGAAETALNALTGADMEQSSSRQQSLSPPTPAAAEVVMPVAAGSASTSASSSNQTSFIPFAVRKHAENVSDGGKRRQAVKALKKKYQEQRMAKTQVQNLSKAKARITRGGSRASPATIADAIEAPQNTPNGSGARSPVDANAAALLVDMGATNMTTASSTCKSTPSKDYPPAAPSVADSLDHESIKTSDTKSTRRKAAAAARKEINHMPTRLTRQHALAYPESYRKAEQAALNSIKQSQAETQAAKQAKFQRESLSVSKDNIKNSESAGEFSSDDDQPLVKVIPSLSKSCKDEDSDAKPVVSKPRASRGKEPGLTMSPDDEDKKTNSAGARKPRAKRRTTSVEQSHELKMIIKTTAESVDSTSLASNDAQSQPSKRPKCASSMAESKDTVELKNTAATAVAPAHEIEAVGGADSLGSSDETPTSKKKLMASIESVMKSFVEDSGWESGGLLMPVNSISKPATPTPLLCPPAKDAGSSQPQPTETDAGRQSRARPSRKTKEAAAIYMELIGQRLNLDGGSDEDNASMGSLPELPNLRKTEQMELELKANIGKERGSSSTCATGPTSVTAGKKRLSAAAKHTTPDAVDEVNESNGLSRRSGSQKPTASASTVTGGSGQKRKLERRNSRKQSDAQVEKLEKSFSESDEEPLAIKAAKVESTTYTPADALDIVSVQPSTANPIFQPPQTPHRRVDDPYSRSNFPHGLSAYSAAVNSTAEMQLRSPINYSPMPQKQSPPLHASPMSAAGVLHLDVGPRDVFDSPHGYPRTPSYQPSPFKTPAQQYSSPATQVSISPVVSSRKDSQLFKSPTATPTSTKQPQYPQQQSPTTSTNRGLHGSHMQPDDAVSPNANSTESVSAILANLMPSKEESCKIFGIASVSLAQSSGPNDTKCTLGKCGSVHKPPLGPVVPTEASAVLSDQMSNKERRKAKVNMTHEQIQKWLSECAVNQEMIDDLCDVDLTIPPEPVNYLSIASPSRDDSSLSGQPAQQQSETTAAMPSSPANVTPTTKSTKASRTTMKNCPNRGRDSVQRNEVSSSTSMATRVASATRAVAAKASSEEPNNVTNVTENMDTESPTKLTASPIPTRKGTAPTPITPKTGSGSASARSTPIPVPPSTPNAKSSAVVYNPKRTPVYNSPIIVEPHAGQRKPIVNTFGAFSPENESSIYSFDKDDDFTPASLKAGGKGQFKRNAKDNSKPAGKTGQAKGSAGSSKTQQDAGSVTLSPDECSKSASIAVQVSLDTSVTPTKTTRSMTTMAASATAATVTTSAATKPVPSASTAEQDSKALDSATADSAAATTDAAGSHTFYIPLQGTHITGGKSDQIIQGVAVKLGTEGPEGPNQRVIMHAKLVTKNQMGANTSAIPESLGNDIVNSLLVTSDGAGISTGPCDVNRPDAIKAVHIGTTQPRFKSSDTAVDNSPKSSIPLRLAYRPRPANEAPINPSNQTSFPSVDSNEHALMVEAPTFRPTEREFADPMEFFDRIYPLAARFGLCRVIPPASFRPECKISDDMRFTAYNQYVHKMLHRWGPSAKELCAIRKYLATQSVQLVHPPWIGGMEVDLPRLYHTVQELGGLKEVIEKKKWGRVAEEMCFPKTAQDRVSKLDDIYCKYLLPYDTLSPAERQKLFDEVEADWAKREAKARRSMQSNGEDDEDDDEDEANADANNGKAKAGKDGVKRNASGANEADNDDEDDDDEDDEEEEEEEEDDGAMECIVEGRKMPLKQFFRIARNTMALWFKNTEPTSAEIEAEFWRHVAVRDSHVCVHSGSIDSSGWGYGFPTPGPKGKQAGAGAAAANAAQSAQTAACAKHPWNLKVLTNNHGSILRSIGPVTGVTVPTLHVGMLFSACCWYRDPHGLPWIEYLHTGGSKIWYGVPEEQSDNFREAFTSLVPTHCQSKTVWLPCDTAMVPPHMLTDRGVSLCRVEQEPGQFVIVFPRAYTSSLTTGYAISESVYFATSNWLDTAKEDFKDIHDSNEPAMFSLEQLLFAVASDNRTANHTLELVLPMLREVYDREKSERELIKSAGVTRNQKVPIKGSKKPHSATNASSAAGSVAGANATAGDDAECDTCRANLYISWIQCDDDAIYCLQHGLQQLEAGRVEASASRMLYAYSMSEIEQLMERIRVRTANAAATHAAQQQHSASTSVAAKSAAVAAAAPTKAASAKGRKPTAAKGR